MADPAVAERVGALSDVTRTRYDALVARGAKSRCVDIAVVGSSNALVGIDTELMSALWTKDPGLSAYNAAMPSFSVGVWPTWIADAVVPELHPRNVLLSLDTGLDWALAASTDLYRQDLGRLNSRRARRGSSIASRSAFLRNRTVLRNWSQIWGPQRVGSSGYSAITEWGMVPELARLPEFTQASDGVLPVVSETQLRAGAVPGFDEADGRRALRESINAARAKGARVFVLDPPSPRPTNLQGDELADYLDNLSRRRTAASAIAKEERATFVALSDELNDPRYWAQLHLNVWGASRMVGELVTELNREGLRADPECLPPSSPTTSQLPPFPDTRTRTKL